MRTSSLVSALAVTAAAPLAVYAASYKLDTEYKGNAFFNGWDFTVGIDANTTGNILYQSQADAQAQKLISVNGAGNAIMKVDNTTVGQGDTFGRASVRINSQKRISYGSLTVMDAVHLPFGCSVWPAFWTQGENWPNNGEIDIMENVNLDTANQYTLHTLNGCQHPPAGSSPAVDTGKLVFQDCFNVTNGNSGCVVRDSRPSSYGAGFASAGGGVFAMEWNADGIKIWFFPRNEIPSDASGTSPNPSGWGTPVAAWPASTCDPKKFFGPQQIIFDITLCGNFAGLDDVFHATCPGTTHCTDLIKDPANYNNAYFEISYLRTFTDTTKSSSPSSASPSTGWSMGLVSTTSVLAAGMMIVLGFTATSVVA